MKKGFILGCAVLALCVSCGYEYDPELKDERNEIEVYCDALLGMAGDDPAEAFRCAFLLDAALSLPEDRQEEALEKIPAQRFQDGTYEVQGPRRWIRVCPSGASLDDSGATWEVSMYDESTLTLVREDGGWRGTFRSEGRKFPNGRGLSAPVESTLYFSRRFQEGNYWGGDAQGIVLEGVRTENDGYRAVFHSVQSLEMGGWYGLAGAVTVDFYHGQTWKNSCTAYRTGKGRSDRFEHRH